VEAAARHHRIQAWEVEAVEAVVLLRSQAWAEGAAEGRHRNRASAVVEEVVHQ
jgi:hypothetical protein